MRKVFVLAVAVAVTCLAAFGHSRAADDKALKDLEGEYFIIAMEGKGTKYTEAELKKLLKDDERTVTIKGSQIIGRLSKKDEPATIVIDSSKNPPHFNTTSTKDGKTETNYGIYKVEKDVLTIIAADKGEEKDRPKDFKPGAQTFMIVLQKKKK